MHKQTTKIDLLKRTNKCTRLHNAPVFDTSKPKNEKVKSNILYRGAIAWNKLPASDRNMEFKESKRCILNNDNKLYSGICILLAFFIIV